MAFALLALAVLLLHLGLLRESAGSFGRPLQRSANAGRPVQVVELAAARPVTAPPATVTTPEPAARRAAAAAPVAAPTAPAETAAPVTVTAALARSPAQDAAALVPWPAETSPSPDADSATPAAPAQAAPEATPPSPPVRIEGPSATALATPASAATPIRLAEAASAAATDSVLPSTTSTTSGSSAGTPPPVYATQLPPSGRLDYRVQRGEATGTAQLHWDASDSGYTLSLQTTAAGGAALDWLSTGHFDGAGLAPLRMVERQRGREQHAVNFQRDKGLISFSGPSRTEPLLHGAQDRLSWLIQLAAVMQARRDRPEDAGPVRLQVASPRGDVDEWLFTIESQTPVEVAGGRWMAVKLVREPQRPYDQRVEVWLAPVGHFLPLGLRLTTVPGGLPLELWLTGGIQAAL